MFSWKKIVFVLLLVFGHAIAFSQQADMNLQTELEGLLENYFSEDETKDTEQLLNELQYIREHPVDINLAAASDLSALYFLTPMQVNAIIDYREKYGNILSVYELAAIDGMDEQAARLVGFFVVFETPQALVRSKYTRHEIMIRQSRLIEKQAGFNDPRKYEGSPDRLYFRWRYSSSALQAGLTGDKDAGESFFRASNPEGFDFYSGFVQYDPGILNSSVIIGDYVVQFGQGLVARQGFSLGKSAESAQIANFNQGIRPHTSTEENNFMRGLGISLNYGRFRVTAFTSFKKFDANIDYIDDEKVFTSIQTSGYHRTAGEIEDKNSTRAVVAGGNLVYEASSFSVGLTGIYTGYNYRLVRSDQDYNKYLFQGKDVTNLSVDYRWGVNRLYVFGEIASNADRGIASLTGVIYQPLDKVELAMLYRNINKHYSAPLASAFTESSRVNDEEGIYFGIRATPLPKVTVSGYIDFFRFKWIKFTTAGPGKGREFLFNVNYKPNKKWLLSGRYFYESKALTASSAYSKKNLDQVRQSVRANITGFLGTTFTVKSRIEQSFYRHDNESAGFFIAQDVGFHPAKLPFNAWGRVAYFNTGDYDSRVYAYENDMLYQYSVPAYYGEGLRLYLTGKVKLCEKVEFWYKVSQTRFFGVEAIGSGNSKIEGNRRTEVKLQIKFRI